MTHLPRASRLARWPMVLLCGLLTFAAACEPDIPQDPAPTASTSPVFDPATSTVPLPNNAALDAQGTLPDLPELGQDSAAGVFADYATNIKGWLPSTAIEIPFSGPLNKDSLTADSIKLFELSATGATPVEIKEFKYEELMGDGPAKSMVTVVPAKAPGYGKTYGAVVLKSVKDANDKAIVEPAAVFLALSKDPLVTEDGVIVNSLAKAQGAETANALEGLRKGLAPFVAGLEAAGVDRKQIGMIFAWSTSTDVFAELDSETATIPLPNTLALDADGTFPSVALAALTEYNAALETDSPKPRTAQVYFEQYLDRLHGWPNSGVPIEAPLTGAVDPATITADTVQMWKLNADGTAERVTDVMVEWDDENNKVVLKPGAAQALNQDYFAFITDGVKTKDGASVKPAIGFKMGLSDKPVLDDSGKSLVPSLSDDQAKSIAGLQQLYGPLKGIIKDQAGVESDKIVAIWSWFTWRDPFVVLDPVTGNIPIPNAFAIDQTDNTPMLPTEGATGLQLALLTELNQRKGWGVNGGGWIPVMGAPIDPMSVKLKTSPDDMEGSIAVADRSSTVPRLMGADEVTLEFDAEASLIRFDFKKPLLEDNGYVGITNTNLKGLNGLPAQPTPFMVFISSPKALVDENGKSTIAQLPDEAAPLAEAARSQYELLFTLAPVVSGDTRSTIASTFAYTTDTPSKKMLHLRAQAQAKLNERDAVSVKLMRACEADNSCANDAGLVTDPGANYNGYDLSNVGAIQLRAEFETTMFLNTAGGNPLDAEFGKIRAYGDAGTEKVGVTVVVPKKKADGMPAEQCGTAARPFRPVIAQHGIGGERNYMALGLANTFASPEHCLAIVSMDFPLHGGRTPGEASPHPASRPSMSGALFLSQNLLAFNGNVMQAVADLSVLTKMIQDGGLNDLVGPDAGVFDTSEIGYIGQSLGGIIGTSFVAVDPNVNVSVLNVPGGRLSWLISDDSSIGSGLLQGLKALGLMPGTFGFFQTVTFIQWAADIIDPATFGSHLLRDTFKVYAYDPATDKFSVVEDAGQEVQVDPAQVIIQMAEGDATIPNPLTEYLAEASGLTLGDTTFQASHSFITQPDPNNAEYKPAQCARDQAATYLSSGLHTGSAAYPDNLKSGTCQSN